MDEIITGFFPQSESLENTRIISVLSCAICNKKVKENKMCPFCSKLFCKICIYSMLSEEVHRCPHCSKFLRKDQLIECRFINEIYQILESYPMNSLQNIEKCLVHDSELVYYCLDCKDSICSDCAILTTWHSGHKLDHLSTVYQSHVETIEKEACFIDCKIEELAKKLSETDENIEKVNKNKDEENEDLSSMLVKMQTRLDIQLKDSLEMLYQVKDKVYEEIGILENLNAKLRNELQQNSKASLLTKTSKIIENLKEITKAPINCYKFIKLPEFSSELLPDYLTGTFILPCYKEAQQTKEVVFSDKICSNGVVWNLKVYPDGNGVAKGNYISVFLELVKGSSSSGKYEYKIEMINHIDSNLTIEKEFVSDFETGEC